MTTVPFDALEEPRLSRRVNDLSVDSWPVGSGQWAEVKKIIFPSLLLDCLQMQQLVAPHPSRPWDSIKMAQKAGSSLHPFCLQLPRWLLPHSCALGCTSPNRQQAAHNPPLPAALTSKGTRFINTSHCRCEVFSL